MYEQPLGSEKVGPASRAQARTRETPEQAANRTSIFFLSFASFDACQVSPMHKITYCLRHGQFPRVAGTILIQEKTPGPVVWLHWRATEGREGRKEGCFYWLRACMWARNDGRDDATISRPQSLLGCDGRAHARSEIGDRPCPGWPAQEDGMKQQQKSRIESGVSDASRSLGSWVSGLWTTRQRLSIPASGASPEPRSSGIYL